MLQKILEEKEKKKQTNFNKKAQLNGNWRTQPKSVNGAKGLKKTFF